MRRRLTRLTAGDERTGRPALLSVHDLLWVVRLPLMATIAWSFPTRWWPAFCRPWARLSVRLHPVRSARQRERLRALFGPKARDDADRLNATIIERQTIAQLQFLRCHWIGGWQPHITLTGREHLESALQAGKGAILWVTPTSYGSLVTKMALSQAGFSVGHLFRDYHGISGTRLGMRLLNPIFTSVEDRFLAARLVMSADDSAGALRTLVQRVRNNQLVSLAVVPLGRRTHAVALANGALWLADGAPSLAVRTGAALLPVFTVCTGCDEFTTIVEAPLTAAPHLDRPGAVQALIAAYAAVVERYLTRWPEQFAALEAITLASPEAVAAAIGKPLAPATRGG